MSVLAACLRLSVSHSACHVAVGTLLVVSLHALFVLLHHHTGTPDEKKDGPALQRMFEPYQPYRSVASWYMYRALESTPYDEAME